MLPLFFAIEHIARMSDRELVDEFQRSEVESDAAEMLLTEMERRRIVF